MVRAITTACSKMRYKQTSFPKPRNDEADKTEQPGAKNYPRSSGGKMTSIFFGLLVATCFNWVQRSRFLFS